jgi:hypothetical protein
VKFCHTDKDHGLAGRVLQMLERLDHFTPEQAIGAAHVGLAGALGQRFRLLAGIDHHLAREIGDAVDKDDRFRPQEILDAAAGVDAASVLKMLRAVPGV